MTDPVRGKSERVALPSSARPGVFLLPHPFLFLLRARLSPPLPLAAPAFPSPAARSPSRSSPFARPLSKTPWPLSSCRGHPSVPFGRCSHFTALDVCVFTGGLCSQASSSPTPGLFPPTPYSSLGALGRQRHLRPLALTRMLLQLPSRRQQQLALPVSPPSVAGLLARPPRTCLPPSPGPRRAPAAARAPPCLALPATLPNPSQGPLIWARPQTRFRTIHLAAEPD